MIEVENPNRMKKRGKKAQNLDIDDEVVLSRREREEIEKQKREQRYRKLHEAGLTDEARKDLARLALVKKQREEAAIKRKLEQEREAEVKKKGL